MGDNLGPNGLSAGRQVFCSRSMKKIVAHEADDPNAFVDFFDSQALAGKDGSATTLLRVSFCGWASGAQRRAVRSPARQSLR